ncbi:transposase [Acidobacterium sp. S8]|uniref:transposase n=1 Tax=Acidobacterium sp. S8 TaxID=1641854 RepID=UPI00131E4452
MGYCGAVPSEDSSGKRTRRAGITKTGNAHLRRIVVEARMELSSSTRNLVWIAQTTGEHLGRD